MLTSSIYAVNDSDTNSADAKRTDPSKIRHPIAHNYHVFRGQARELGEPLHCSQACIERRCE